MHKGGNHAGPAIAFALRPGSPTATGSKRPRWDGRHQLVRANDCCDPNTRCYFDRFVDRVKYPDCLPKVPLRPTYRLDVEPEESENPKVYRTWDAWHARWVEQWQWAEAPGALAAASAAAAAQSAAAAGGAAGAADQRSLAQSMNVTKANKGPKPRSPRRDCDLLAQREREKDWDSKHHTVFSRANGTLHPNYRCYFDRWKDERPTQPTTISARVPSWRLPVEKKPLLRSSSAPKHDTFGRQERQRYSLPDQKPWIGNFNSRS